jgi:rhodanese-related sulfurtransferase
MTRVEEIGHEEVQKLAGRGATVIDALPPDDYNSVHLPGAINLPLHMVNAETLGRLNRERPIVVYCADTQCDLSPRLAARLAVEGFAEVYDYTAGLADWSGRGLPLEGADSDIATAGDLVQPDLPRAGIDTTLSDLVDHFGDHTLLAVVDENDVLLGRLQREEVERWVSDGQGARKAGEVMHPGPTTFRPDVPVAEMAEWFERRGFDAFIITTLDGKPAGVLYREVVERLMAAHEKHAEHVRK